MEELVVRHPLASVGLEHLWREGDNAVHAALGERADCTIGHEATDEGAVKIPGNAAGQPAGSHHGGMARGGQLLSSYSSFSSGGAPPGPYALCSSSTSSSGSGHSP